MRLLNGPAPFLAQFANDEAPFNSRDRITRRAVDSDVVADMVLLVRLVCRVVLLAVALCGASVVLADEQAQPFDPAAPWTGRWNSVWATGSVQLELEQEGNIVSGGYEPGHGKINGWIVDGRLHGRWSQSGSNGEFLFALSSDGLTFAGRYDGDHYWNGERTTGPQAAEAWYGNTSAPQTTFRNIVAGMNESADGNLAATLQWNRYLHFVGKETEARNQRQRRNLLWHLVDLSTFDLADVSNEGDQPFEIGPAASRERYKLHFELSSGGRWLLQVPPIAELRKTERRFLDSLGVDSYDAWVLARYESPREAMRRFMQVASQSGELDSEAAADVMDLGFLPESLRALEVPLYVDYLRQVINRTGVVHYQQIPDNPNQLQPHVYYRHPMGSVVLAPEVDEEGASHWRFTAETLQNIDHVYNATEQLPAASDAADVAPVSDFFALRERFAAFSPMLLERDVLLENWQWLALAAVLLVAVLIAWLLTRALRWYVRWQFRVRDSAVQLAAGSGSIGSGSVSGGASGGQSGSGFNVEPGVDAGLGFPVALTVSGAAGFLAVGKLGLPNETAVTLSHLTSVSAIIGVCLLTLRAVHLVGKHVVRRTATTESYVDEIVASLATGLIKLMVIVVAILFIADAVGLPYEGVIAGLGVGGIALAIAARETVSNFIGAATLLADRPFKRGDVVETSGVRARVLDVGLRSTKLRCHDDSIMMVPNAMLANEIIMNRGVRTRRQIYLTIGLTYDTPREKLDQFVDNLRETWLQQPTADQKEHYIALKNFGASSIDIVFWGYAIVRNRAEQYIAEHAFVGDIVDCARRSGVEFAFPTRTVHMVHDGDQNGDGPGGGHDSGHDSGPRGEPGTAGTGGGAGDGAGRLDPGAPDVILNS